MGQWLTSSPDKRRGFQPYPHYLCGRRAELRFTVRRPPTGEVSPCGHRPPGGDVACSVNVGVARPCGAGFALENRLALTISGSDVPARGASLRRVRGQDLLDPTVSLMLQTRGQQTPTAPADGPVKSALLGNAHARLLQGSSRRSGHRPHVKSLDSDRVETPRDVGRNLFDPVLASVSLTRFDLRDRAFRAGTPVGATLGARQSLLQHLQSFGLTPGQAGNAQQTSGRQRRRHCDATVDTDHAPLSWSSDGARDVGERDMPAAGPIAGDPVGAHAIRHRSRVPKAHPAHLGHPHPTKPAIQPFDVMPLHCNLSESLMHTAFTPPRAPVGSREEVPHGLGEVPQRLLLHGLRAGRQPVVCRAGRGQLSTLLVVAGCTASGLPVLLLLDGQVPHIPGLAAMLGQRRRLLGGRKQPVSRHPGNLTAHTDTPPKGEAAVTPPAEAGGLQAASIR